MLPAWLPEWLKCLKGFTRKQGPATKRNRYRLTLEQLEDRWVPSNIVTLATFNPGSSGAFPEAGLVEDGSGNLFGITPQGGTSGGYGAVYELAHGSTTITTLASFSTATGTSYPSAGLAVDSSDNLFGTTGDGGTSGDGTVFEVAQGSNTITILASFNGTNGANPHGGLIEDGSGNLFGTTYAGGMSGDGTVFEVAHGSTTITTLASFNNNNGAGPQGLVADSNGNLFGTTDGGGTRGYGTVYELAYGSTTITTLASFNGTSNGANQGSLVEDSSGNLYGTTNGGTTGYGLVYGTGSSIVYEMAHGSTTITTLASFEANPDLVVDSSGNLFGTTAFGGMSGGGTVFEVAQGSHGASVLARFSSTSGYGPNPGLVVDSSGNLFGTTYLGGTSGCGAVFEVVQGSHTITTLASFNGTSNGANPEGNLVEDNSGNFFGTTRFGGTSGGYGTVFELVHGSNTIITLASFNNNNGANPEAGLVEDSSGNLFGITSLGGAYGGPYGEGCGTVFEAAHGSNTITTLAFFDGSNGDEPFGGLVEDSSGNLFGTTSIGGANGGTIGDGTVFEVAQGSNTITTLASFNGSNGAYPSTGLVEDSSGNLFGTTSGGGAYGGTPGGGTVFEVAQGSNTITTLASFNGSPPVFTGLIEDSSGNLFGTTTYGGTSSAGTVFEVAQGSNTITTLASFNNSNGADPYAGLVEDSNGNLIGTTWGGGAPGAGTLFELAQGSNTITTLASFNNSNGASPEGGLIEDSNGNFFGTTNRGGTSGTGTVFELDTLAPTVTMMAPANNSSTSNNEPTLSANATDNAGGTGLASVQFQYSSDGGATWSNAGPAQTSGPFSFTFASPLANGSYQARAIATDNAGNSTTSTPVTFTIASVADNVTHFSIVPSASTTQVGSPVTFTITALDSNNRAATYFNSAATITSSDAAALGSVTGTPTVSLPLTVILTNGTATFPITFNTVGNQTVTGTSNTIVGTSNPVAISGGGPPGANSFIVTPAVGTQTTGVPFNVTVTAVDQSGNPFPGFTGPVSIIITDSAATPVAPYTFVTADHGVHTFTVTLNSSTLATGVPGTTIIATGKNAGNFAMAGSSAPVTVQGLVVTGFQPTATGFTVTFSKPFTPADLTMFGPTGTVQDVTLTGVGVANISGNLNVPGTLYLDPTTPNTVVFKATSAFLDWLNSIADNGNDTESTALPDGTYTVTLKSGTGTNGFVDALNTHLDGLATGGSANYTQTFTTTYQDDAHTNAHPTAVLSIPDFARGPDGATTISVPNFKTTPGIPIVLYNAAGVTDATFTLAFNPQLLTPTAGTTADSTATGSTFTMGTITSVDSTHATVSFTYHNATAKSGTVVLGDILATVPNSAASLYKTKELLALSGITVTPTPSAPVLAADGIHVDAYLGDVHVTAGPTLNTADALDVSTKVSTSGYSGFAAYALLDPVIIANVFAGVNDGLGGLGTVVVNGSDVTALFSKAAGIPVPAIPSIPAAVTVVSVSGADPTVSLVGGVQTKGIVSVAVLLDHPHPAGSTGMTEAHLALTYDPSVLSVSASDITLGSIPGAGWRITSEVDAATGQIGINLFNTEGMPITATQSGSLVNIAFHVMPGAAVTATSVQLVSQVTANGQRFVTDVDDDQGPLALSLGMDAGIDLFTALGGGAWRRRQGARV